MRRALAGVVCAGLAIAGAAMAQEPSGPPPPSSNRVESGSGVIELLPDLGQIGSEVGIFGGGSWNPYQAGQGIAGGGFVDLPLRRAPGGKLSYEILIGLSHVVSDPFIVTNPLAVVANLASGASPQDALAGPPFAPFPVRREVRSRIRILEISPFALKYALASLGEGRIRPYVAGGLDFVVVISREDPVRDESLIFTGTAPFDDPLIGGIVSQAPELTARGLPSGQGNVEVGFHLSGGLELRISRRFSLNADYRFLAYSGTKARVHTAAGALGFHW